MDLGLSWAGFNLVYANEIDNGASETYRNNLGHHIETKSITDVGFKAYQITTSLLEVSVSTTQLCRKKEGPTRRAGHAFFRADR